MAVFATDTQRLGAVLKHEYEPQLSYCRDVVVVNDSAATFKVGAVLGKVTATGKYKLSKTGAADGSETPVAVFIADGFGVSNDTAIANATDTNVLVLSRGPVIVGAEALQIGTGHTIATVKAALKAVGIIVESTL